MCNCIAFRIWLEASPPPHLDIFVRAGYCRSSSEVWCYIVTDRRFNSYYDGIHSPLFVLYEVTSSITALQKGSSRRNYFSGDCKWWYGYIFCYLGNQRYVFISMRIMIQSICFNIDYQIILGRYIFMRYLPFHALNRSCRLAIFNAL